MQTRKAGNASGEKTGAKLNTGKALTKASGRARGGRRLWLRGLGIVLFALFFCVLTLRTRLFESLFAGDGAMQLISEENLQEQLAGKTEDMTIVSEKGVRIACNGVVLPYDKKSAVFYWSQNRDASDWEGSLEAVSADGGARLYVVEDALWQDKAESLRTGHEFCAVLVDGEQYARVQLTAGGLPFVAISTERAEEPVYEENDIDNVVFNSDTRYYGDVTIFRADADSGTRDYTWDGSKAGAGGYRILQSSLVYHGRGNTSNNFEKKGYAIKFLNEKGEKEKQRLFGIGESAKWKLLAVAGDVTKVREKTAWQLWEEISRKHPGQRESVTDMEYCEVVIDDEYLGLYQILRTPDVDTLSLGNGEILYKILQAEMPTEEDIQNSIRDGYPVCYPIRIRYPENEVLQKNGSYAQAWEPMRKFLSVCDWYMWFDDLHDMMDADNVTDFFVFLQATSAADNARKNTYMVASPQANGTARMKILPWDLNYTFGDVFDVDLEKGKTAFDEDTSQIYFPASMYQMIKLNNYGEFDRIRETWNNYRQDVLSEEHILGLFDANMNYLCESGAFARNAERWPGEHADTDLTKIKDYVRERLAFMDEYVMQKR